MPATTSQYSRVHAVTVLTANWGVAQTHAHNLNDGSGSGYTPNHVMVTNAYVTIAGANYAISPTVIVCTAVGAANATFVVGDVANVLRDALTRKYGAVPTSLTFFVHTRFVHSQEIGSTATPDETIGTLAAGPVPVELADMVPSAALESIFVRTPAAGGLDTNDGRTAGTAFATFQRACNDLMAMSPIGHDVLVDAGAGTFAGNWTLEGVEMVNGASLYIVGAAPATAAKTSTSAGAAAFAASGRDHGLIRLSPDAAWDVAPAAGDIGRTLRIAEAGAANVAYATIAQVSTGNVPGANCYIDLVMDPILTGAAPAWTIANGTTYEILNEAAVDVTRITGNVNIFNVKKAQGSADSGTGAHTPKFNLLGHIRFDTGTVVIQGCDRFSYHGSRFENGLTEQFCRDCTSTTNSVPIAAASRYWPAAIWTRLGYSDGAGGTIAETADAYGGCGCYVAGANYALSVCDGIKQGVVVETGRTVVVGGNADIAFGGGNSLDTLLIQTAGRATFNYTRLSGQIRSDTDGKWILGDYNSWLARAGAVDDTPLAAALDLNTGLFSIEGMSRGHINLNAAARLEGINSAGAAANNGNVVGRVITGGQLFMTGGHDVDLYGAGGWLYARDCAVVYMSGARAMAVKAAATAAHLDWDIADGCTVRSIGDITRAAADNTPGPELSLEWGSTWVHGDVATDTGLYVIGDGAGAGIDCGPGTAITVGHGSTLVLAVPRVYNSNANAACRSLVVTHRSAFFAAAVAGANSCYLLGNAGGGGPGAASVDIGVVATFAAPNPLVAVVLNDIPAVPAGTEHLAYYEIE